MDSAAIVHWFSPTTIVRRAIVRYAISCPDPKAKAFLARARQADPKLVHDVEEQMSLYDPATRPKP